MPVISRNKRFEENFEELKPETFGINCLKKDDYESNDSKLNRNRLNNDDFDDDKSSLKYWIIAILLIVVPAILLARTPFIKLNFNKQIKANFIELPELQPFTGNLKQNKLLENTKYIGKNKMQGPEAIVFDKEGNIYTGLVNGQIVKIDKKFHNNIMKLVQIGEETNETICNSNIYGVAKCGRPLGLRIDKDKNMLYVADSYYGLFKVDILKGTKTLILSSNDKRFGTAKLKLVDDLDLDGDVIYFIDSSYERDYSEFLEEHVEALSRGRLFRYNQTSDELEFLIENLYFPNGLQLTPEKDAILINENSMARIIKFYLKGDKNGSREIFADLPGFGDNIRMTDHQTYLVAIPAIRHKSSMLDLFGTLPLIRTLFGYFIDFKVISDYVPKYGLVLEYDLNGKLLKSWHDPTGKIISSISHAELFNNKIYLGSFHNNYMGVVDY